MNPWIPMPAASLRISTRSGRSPNNWKKRSIRPAAGGHSRSLRDPLVSEKPTAGYPSAICVTRREICVASAVSDFRNFRRAGRL